MIRLGVCIWAFSTGHPWVGVFMILSLLGGGSKR
jgi:hypothetical protein